MFANFLRYCCLLSGLVIFSGCGLSSAAAGMQGVSSGTPNTSPGIHSPGPISFATDHTDYASTDIVLVTVTNELTQTIYAYDHQASCSIVQLQRQQGTTWVNLSQTNPEIAKCPLGTVSTLVAVQPGGVYHAHILAGYLHQGDHQFPLGTYRLALAYTITPTSTATSSFVTVYSLPIAVVGDILPEPVSTAPIAPGEGTPQMAPTPAP